MASGSEPGGNGGLTLGKAPFLATFRLFFDDFLGVFLRAFSRAREWARIRLSKRLLRVKVVAAGNPIALVWNDIARTGPAIRGLPKPGLARFFRFLAAGCAC
jgi:hypothetical protein